MKSKVTRIHEDLDLEIKKIANKNRLSYTQASRELAKATKKLNGIKFKMEDVLKF